MPRRAHVALALLMCGIGLGFPAQARRHRDRWSNTLSLGATIGLGSPLGIVGAFLEYRPIRWGSVSAGGGFGGTFGAAVAGSVYIDPISTRIWSLGAGGSLSHNFSYISGTVVQGRPPLPSGSDWASLEVQSQLRPSRGVFVRLGVGYGWLLNTQAFYIASQGELSLAGLPSFPLANPTDAVRAAAGNQSYGLWFVHLDIATVWRL